MRFILFLMSFVSLSTLACIPCDKDLALKVSHQAIPKFQKEFSSRLMMGEVSFELDVDYRGKIEKIVITDIQPMEVPKSVVLDMIARSKFTPLLPRDGFSKCGLKGYALTMEFMLPQKVSFEL
ncbi:hypothetical protein CWC22_022860 [Pseudoalteromonas rubra]|uniref:TonB C-terminal domain-containing protein n=2 Tax=Pseudoalteromonas rubra TaxID=43658 RepID=A0A5S3V257_9GAMM|nr:hypothetical protein [Pseudoalteromonas rubra]QPB85844.1 hypothetical protein CWC22_022860 [Pseudoalteromonas rubra]